MRRSRAGTRETLVTRIHHRTRARWLRKAPCGHRWFRDARRARSSTTESAELAPRPPAAPSSLVHLRQRPSDVDDEQHRHLVAELEPLGLADRVLDRHD